MAKMSAYSAVMNAGGPAKGRSSQNENIQASNKAEKKIDRKLAPGMYVNPGRAERDRAAARGDEQGNNTGAFPIGAYHHGKFLPIDERDTSFDLKKRVLANSERLYGAQAVATVPITDADIKFIQSKKEREEYLNTLGLAEYLIDETDPFSQDYAYSLFPELETVPQDEYAEQLAIQAAVYEILRTGRLAGKEDLYLIMRLIRGDVKLPQFPAWDPNGVFQAQGNPIWQAGLKSYRAGLFNPRKWGMTDQEVAEAAAREQQMFWKRQILRRVFKGLRKKNNAELDRYIGWISGVTGRTTDPNPLAPVFARSTNVGNNDAAVYNIARKNPPDWRGPFDGGPPGDGGGGGGGGAGGLEGLNRLFRQAMGGQQAQEEDNNNNLA